MLCKYCDKIVQSNVPFFQKTQNLHFLHFGQWTSFDLCTAVSLLDSLTITLQVNIISKENTSRVDFAIKKIISKMLEEIICIIKGK